MNTSAIVPQKQEFMRGSWLTRHPVTSFFILAYVIAWLLWLPLILSKGNGLGLIPLNSGGAIFFLSLITLGSFGPALSALVMSAITAGKAGVRLLLRRVVRGKVGFHWYLMAMFSPLLALLPWLFFMPGALAAFFSLRWEAAGLLLGAVVASILLVFLSMIYGTPLLEEIGWRGFALPRLQEQMGPVRGSIVLGTLWGFWHAPLAFFTAWGLGYRLAGLALAFPLFVLWTISLALIMTWMFNNTRGSLFIAIMFHAAIDTFVPLATRLVTIAMHGTGGSGDNLLLFAVFPFLPWFVVAGIVLLATRGKLSYRPSIVEDIYPSISQPEATGQADSEGFAVEVNHPL